MSFQSFAAVSKWKEEDGGGGGDDDEDDDEKMSEISPTSKEKSSYWA